MTTYINYFTVLSKIRDIDKPEWRTTAAGLVVLRLVDDWFKHGHRLIHTDSPALEVARDVLAQIPRTDILRALLAQILDAVEHADTVETQAANEPLITYAWELQGRGNFDLAQDVIFPLQFRAEAKKDVRTIIKTSAKLGYLLRITGQLDLAEENYNKAMHYARASGDVESEVRATIGRAKLLVLRGAVTYADSQCADAAVRARSIGATMVYSSSLHDQAFVAATQGEYHNALSLYYKVLQQENRHPHRVMADLAASLLRVGRISESRHINLVLAVSAQEQSTRWQATNNLMNAAILERDQSAFELYQSALTLTPLPPWLAMGYHQASAIGYRAFGNNVKARNELHKMNMVARKHQICIDHPPATSN